MSNKLNMTLSYLFYSNKIFSIGPYRPCLLGQTQSAKDIWQDKLPYILYTEEIMHAYIFILHQTLGVEREGMGGRHEWPVDPL